MNKYVFRRREQKYILNADQRQALDALMQQYMQPDKFSRSCVCSIYYDTPDRRMIRRSMEKPVYKEKLRLRSYGRVGPGDMVFLELKKKYKGVVYKRRICIKLEDAVAYMADPAARLDAGQIGREIDYVKDFYGQLAPAVYLYYDRLAWKSPEQDLRITLDWNVRARTDNMDLSADTSGEPLLEPGLFLMEVKTAEAMPLWLSAFLSGQKLYKTSFSKYGRLHAKSLTEKQIESRGYDYA